MDFLQLTGKTILVFGVANRKSVACHIGRVLREAGAEVVYAVRTRSARDQSPSCSAMRKSTSATSNMKTRSPDCELKLASGTRHFTAWCIRSPSPTMKME